MLLCPIDGGYFNLPRRVEVQRDASDSSQIILVFGLHSEHLWLNRGFDYAELARSVLVSIALCNSFNGGRADSASTTKDNSIVMVDGEWDLNAGQQGVFVSKVTSIS